MSTISMSITMPLPALSVKFRFNHAALCRHALPSTTMHAITVCRRHQLIASPPHHYATTTSCLFNNALLQFFLHLLLLTPAHQQFSPPITAANK